MSVEYLIGTDTSRVGTVIADQLRNRAWTRLTVIVAFARMSGVKHVESLIRDFVARGGRVDLTVGMDLGGTTYEAAWYLMNAVAPSGQMLLASAEPGATFHPKVFVFSNASVEDSPHIALVSSSAAVAIVGSSNLTGGGLFVNDEASSLWRPDLNLPEEASAWQTFVGALTRWLVPGQPATEYAATHDRLRDLALEGRLPQELSRPAARALSRPGGLRPGRNRRQAPQAPALVGALPPRLAPPPDSSPPGLTVLIARLAFGGSRRWPQWELNTDVLEQFFDVSTAGEIIERQAVSRSRKRLAAEQTPLIIGTNRNRRLEFPEPDKRPDPCPDPALLVVVDRRPGPFRYAILLPADSEYEAVGALNNSSEPIGHYVEHTKRVLVPYSALEAVWPDCPL